MRRQKSVDKHRDANDVSAQQWLPNSGTIFNIKRRLASHTSLLKQLNSICSCRWIALRNSPCFFRTSSQQRYRRRALSLPGPASLLWPALRMRKHFMHSNLGRFLIRCICYTHVCCYSQIVQSMGSIEGAHHKHLSQ